MSMHTTHTHTYAYIYMHTGGGHISPIAGWHEASDSYAVLDCWYETEPFWAAASQVWAAASAIDEEAGRSRGCLILTKE